MGSVNLDNTGSGSAITLSSDGTSLLLDGTAIGGGGADLYAANESSPTAQPSATGTNSIAIGDSAISTGTNSFAGPKSRAQNSSTVALGINSNSSSYGALGNYSVAIGYEAKAANSWAISIGREAISTQNESFAIGKSLASGDTSFSAQITNNTSSYGATGANSTAIGELAKATGQRSGVFAGNANLASGIRSGVLAGNSNIASGGRAVVIGGASNNASGDYSTARGSYGNTNSIRLCHATGLSQHSQGVYYLLGYDTTDATPIALNSNLHTPSATNQIVLPNNSAFTFSGTVVAREKASEGTDVGAWEVKGIIRREANAGTTVLVNSVINELNTPTGWAIALTADTTNGCLKVEATGVASTNIRWIATIETSEVKYA